MIQIDVPMPESCPKCKFYQDQHNTEYCIVTSYGLRAEDIFAVTNSIEKAKPYWCPLREVPDTNVGKWISVKDGMPPEKETIFAKFKGTDQWSPAMFATSSEDVRVVVQFEDGTRKVWHDNTMDGKWKCERENVYPKRTVIYWMPNPELPKEKT